MRRRSPRSGSVARTGTIPLSLKRTAVITTAVSACTMRAVDQQRGHARLDLTHDLHLRADREVPCLEHRGHDDVAHVGRLRRDLELPGFDPSAVEDRVDENEQLTTTLLDDRQALDLLFRERVPPHELRKAQDRVERCLEVVTHRREEQSPHAFRRLANVDGSPLGRSELAEDPAQRVDRVEKRCHVGEARIVLDDCTAHDLGHAGATDLACRQRTRERS